MSQKHSTLPLCAALCAAVACVDAPAPEPEPAAHLHAAVEFSTAISKTRAYNNLWEGGDLIGVYMVPSSDNSDAPVTAESWALADEGAIVENMKYGTDLETGQTDNSVVFTGVDDDNTLMWPTNGSKVDFVAYYPWLAEGIEDFTLPVDVRAQNPQRKIDLMWSNNAREQSLSAETEPTLRFTHSLAKLVFNLTDLGGGTLDGMTATISGLHSTARFDLAAGRIVEGSEAGDDDFEAVVVSSFDADANGTREQAVVEAIVLPSVAETDYMVTFDFEDGDKAVLALKKAFYKAGKRYIYNVNFLNGGGGVQFLNGEFDSILPWEDVEQDDDIDVSKGHADNVGSTPALDAGAEWSSGTLADGAADYTVIGSGTYDSGGYTINSGSATISKTDYDGGVERVRIDTRGSMSAAGRIESVKVGDVSLRYGSPAGATYADITSSEQSNLFVAPDGDLPSGDIVITVVGTKNNIIVRDFVINPN